MEDINLFPLFIIELFFDNANIGKNFKKICKHTKKSVGPCPEPYLANKKMISNYGIYEKRKIVSKVVPAVLDSAGSA